MLDEYKKLDTYLERDWIQGTQFETLMLSNFTKYSDTNWRQLLCAYCWRYYDMYHSDWLDKAFAFIKEEFKHPEIRMEWKHVLEDIQEEIACTKGEYSFSLSAIAEAVERLLYSEPITIDCIRKIINHVWFAYSCNISEEEFLEIEDNILSDWVQHLE